LPIVLRSSVIVLPYRFEKHAQEKLTTWALSFIEPVQQSPSFAFVEPSLIAGYLVSRFKQDHLVRGYILAQAYLWSYEGARSNSDPGHETGVHSNSATTTYNRSKLIAAGIHKSVADLDLYILFIEAEIRQHSTGTQGAIVVQH
jgi:hypothetical protein